MPTTFLFAGGGTGGHLFPGLAIAEQLAAQCSAAGGGGSTGTKGGIKAVFACSTRPLDAEILRTQCVEFHPIPAEPFGLSPRRLVKFLTSWSGAVRASRDLIRAQGGAPTVHVVAMGGFVAAPFAHAARAENVPVTLVNLDAVPGRANRWIARRAGAIFTSAEVDKPSGGTKWTLVPPIVRKQAMPPGPPELCRARFKLEPNRPTLLVTGASQGAKSINDFLIAMLERSRDAFIAHGWQVIHQTGKGEVERVRAAYAQAKVHAVTDQFIEDMGAAWGAADLAVSRAGAGSVAEAWAAKVPAIFMPYPYHKDEHQRINALPLERAGVCVIAKDLIDPSLNADQIGPTLIDLLTHPDKRAGMRTGFATLGPADGANRIAAFLKSARPTPTA